MLNIRKAEDCAHDFMSLGAMVERLDTGVLPLHVGKQYERHCSGGEYNPAASLAKCFGMRTAVCTANVRYPVGWWIESEVKKMGVHPYFKWFDYDGLGLPCMATVYSDRGQGVRAAEVFYRRRGEAASLLTPKDFDWKDLFEVKGTRWFHSGGIYAALVNDKTLIPTAMRAAKKAGAVVSFDLNYRGKIWEANGSHGQARELLEEIAGLVDVMYGNEEDFQKALGFKGPEVSEKKSSKLETSGFKHMLGDIKTKYPNMKVVATTLREVHSTNRHGWKAVLSYEDDFFETPTYELDVLCRVGGGDGFAAGLTYGLLNGEDPETALRLGWAHGALLTTYPGDVTMARPEIVRGLAAGQGARIQR